MLKSRKNVRKVTNILIILMAIIVILGVCPITALSLELGNGTITPIYKPKWTKVSSSISGETISVVLKGTASESQTIDDNTKINYSSNVTTALTTDDILVYINGELDGDTNKNGELDTGETPSIAKNLSLPSPSATAGEITQTLTLSNFVQTARQPDKPYKEWSGNISIKILGRGEATDTYDADVLIDVYGNQNMMELDDATGTWNDIIFKDDDSATNINTSGTMFTDFVKPELTYKYSNTVIDHNTKKVTVVFDVVDKYFKEVTSTFTKDNLTVMVSDYTAEEVQAKIDKELKLKTIASETTDATTGAVYKTDGSIYYNGAKIGQRYELIISELEQDPNDGFDFSGYMNIAFPANIIADLSGNKNNAKTIAIGIDETDGNMDTNESGSSVVVDVVDPIWKVQNKTVTTATVAGKPVTTATMDLLAIDKYFKETTLDIDDIQVIVAGVNIAAVDAEGNLTIAPELERELSDPIYIKWNDTAGTYESNVAQSEANGVKYTFTISNLEESNDLFFDARADYATDTSTGRVYREYSGPTKIYIPEKTIKDQYNNESEEFTIDLGNIDTLKPEVIKVSSTYNINAENVELSTHTIVFDIVDKYFDTSAITTTDTSKIHVYLDGEEATSTITKTITNIEQLNAMIGGTSQKVGYRYTLELSNFQNPRSSIDYTREYTDWSGDLTVKIDANTAYDKNGLSNVETILAGNEENTSNVDYADFVDYIKPDATYQFSDSDVDYTNKKFTMTFDITDKFYHEDLSLTELQILVSAENETEEGEDGYYDLMSNSKIGKSLISEDITNTVNGTSKVIGKRYTLVLSNLEQLQRIEGNYYLDYSGSITIIIPEGSVKDKGPKGDGTTPNGNDVTSIVSGINIPGGEVTDIEIIDVVHPIWERESFTTDIHNKTATITVLGTDKDFWEDQDEATATEDDKYGTLTTDEIKLFVNGVETSGNITLNTPTKLYEERIVETEYGDGALDGELTTETVQYGIRYTITITNLPIDKNQVKIQLIEGSLVDKSNNLSRSTEFLVYNTLISTVTETEATSKFLNEIVPEGGTAIARQDIEKVVFVNSIAGSTADGVQNVWDASAQRDNSILAWYSETSAPYTVYIGSNDDIYGNVDSSCLFSYIGESTACTATQAVSGLNLLKTSNVTKMQNMFWHFGNNAMTSLDLGNFDTSNVTIMSYMFGGTGSKAMITLNLGNKFDTSKVTNMTYMFGYCGRDKMTTLNLGNNFDTSSVILMKQMFEGCGKFAMTSLDLGSKFNTSSVTNMSEMFKGCGYTAMTSLDLGDKFDTSNAINMYGMFQDCGYTAMTSLDLSSGTDSTNTTQFNTSSVTNMDYMFGRVRIHGNANTELRKQF